ncbi:MAG: ComF family protein [Desulfobacterales bacterium]|nr:MAG: ComF family protein [Desulfobacterales bacterium]
MSDHWQHVIGRWLGRISTAVQEAFFPAKCVVCGGFFHPPPRSEDDFWRTTVEHSAFSALGSRVELYRLFAPFLCRECARQIITVESPICSSCGIMFKSREGQDHLCEECIRTPKRFRRARAAVVYEQALRTVIQRYKYRGKIQLARPLGRLLFTVFRRYWEETEIDLIIPVPLHRRRFRKRGYNQAFLPLREWKHASNAVGSAVPVNRRVLERSKPTAPQTGLGRKERMVNLQDAFTVREPAVIQNQRILLVDDVYTTGATVEEGARALLNAGAACVDVLTLARAI